jgi:hypothetical protein
MTFLVSVRRAHRGNAAHRQSGNLTAICLQ